MSKRRRSVIKSAKGLKLATKLHRICELAGYKVSLVNVWHNGVGTSICLPDGTLSFTVADPRCTDDGGPKFLGFVFIEPWHEVSFFGPALGAEDEIRSIFENMSIDVWSMSS